MRDLEINFLSHSNYFDVYREKGVFILRFQAIVRTQECIKHTMKAARDIDFNVGEDSKHDCGCVELKVQCS